MACNRVMVVDGSNVSRELLTRMMAMAVEGAEIIPCGSAAEALTLAENGCFDFITTALMLPDMDGLELCRQLRDSESHRYTPLLVISGDADERLLKEGFAAGVTDYFDKSQGYQAFCEFVRNFTQRNTGLVGRVLYVEDSLTVATMTRRVLEHHGLQVTHVTTAEAALEILQRQRDSGEAEGEEAFDTLITDFHLKGELTGGDLLHALRLRLHFSQQELPVLVMTGKEDTTAQIALFHAGANDFAAKPIIEEVFMARLRSLLLIKRQHDALRRQARDMKEMVHSDPLTGTRNRRFLLDEGAAYLAAAQGQPFWTFIIDVDHIKTINADFGYSVGDHVLAAIGGLLQERFPDGEVARFGGEEFAVLLPAVPRALALQRAETLRQAVEELQPEGLPVTVSVGLAGSEEHPQADFDQLFGLADEALFKVKAEGRNGVWVHGPSALEPLATAVGQ